MQREFRVLLIQKSEDRKEALVALVEPVVPEGVRVVVDYVSSILEGIQYLVRRSRSRYPHLVVTHHDDDEIVPPCNRPHCAEEIMGIISAISPDTGIVIFSVRSIKDFPSGDYPLAILPEGADQALPQIVLYHIADKIPEQASGVVRA